MAERAAAFMRDVGAKQAIAEFNDTHGAFIDGVLFVVVYGPGNRIVAGSLVPALIGKDATHAGARCGDLWHMPAACPRSFQSPR